jgi:phage gp36-like protein
MAIFTQDDLKAFVPEAYQAMAMDDANTGMIDDDVFDSILQACEDWIVGYLEQAGLTLDDPAPRRLKVAAMRYAEYTLWDRRGHTERADACYKRWIEPLMTWLGKIARGDETLIPLDADTTDIAAAIIEDARTYDPCGRLMI